MYELIMLTDRSQFYQSNKIGFTIFGHLYELILIIKDRLRIENEKLFLFSYEKKKAN
jgi:hypothetical protein